METVEKRLHIFQVVFKLKLDHCSGTRSPRSVPTFGPIIGTVLCRGIVKFWTTQEGHKCIDRRLERISLSLDLPDFYCLSCVWTGVQLR